MARPTLMTHRKFARFASDIGSAALARGILEILWDACYEAGDDYLGTAADIDRRIGWTGEPGKVALALVACGLPEGHGFVEPSASESGAMTYRVHDLWHHAPDYVAKRRNREMERRRKLVPVASDRRTAPNGEQCPPSPDWQDGVGRTPSPSPSPSPSPQVLPSEVSSATLSAAKPPDTTPAVLTFPTIGKGPKTWALTEAHCADWREAYPGLDVLGECRKALEWVKANNPKTAKGMPAFLVNWFNRAVQRGGNSRPLGLATTNGVRVNTQLSPAMVARIRAAQESA